MWLDAITADRVLGNPQAVMMMRAEAARWRGDAAAAATWDQRLAAMRALATDDRMAYLFGFAYAR